MNATMTELRELSPKEKSIVVAISVVLDRLRDLSDGDRDDICQMFKLYSKAANTEEREAADEAIWEILLGEAIGVNELPLNDPGASCKEFEGWKAYIAKRIISLRKEAHLTQDELAIKSGLPQSHISRIETCKLSPSEITISKIAAALGVPPSAIDPSFEDSETDE